MGSDVVIDSCVVAKWILPETDSHKAQQVLSDIAQSGGRAIVLDFALLEVANAIWKQLHRGLITRDEAPQFLSDLETLPVLVQPARSHLRLAFAIADQCDRSLYDALCVAAARELGTRTVTADEHEPLKKPFKTDIPK